jgi:hypothetical protein
MIRNKMPKPLFQKRHYKRIIALLKDDIGGCRVYRSWGTTPIYYITAFDFLTALEKMFEEDNKGFNREKFLAELCRKEDK